ncbi:MAG: hypothetical protein Q9209_002481 [Squamulea sp. 1 TL-2023]
MAQRKTRLINSLTLILTTILNRASTFPSPPIRDQPSLSQSNTTFAPSNPVLCWDSRHAHHAPSYSGCESIVSFDIATGPRPSTTISFSRQPHLWLQNRVPKSWIGPQARCFVVIDVPHDAVEDASLMEIQAAARTVMMKCVLGEDHLGGFTYIGRSGSLLVEVLGDTPRMLKEVSGGD